MIPEIEYRQHFRQHVPNSCEGVDPIVQCFDTLEELLNIPFVKQWIKDKDFYRYSINPDGENKWMLMQETNKGKSWWVIGYLRNCKGGLKLPKWEPKK